MRVAVGSCIAPFHGKANVRKNVVVRFTDSELVSIHEWTVERMNSHKKEDSRKVTDKKTDFEIDLLGIKSEYAVWKKKAVTLDRTACEIVALKKQIEDLLSGKAIKRISTALMDHAFAVWTREGVRVISCRHCEAWHPMGDGTLLVHRPDCIVKEIERQKTDGRKFAL